MRELAAHIYSAQAALALKVARLDGDGAWAGDGYLSIVHWLSIHLGMGRVSARELVPVGTPWPPPPPSPGTPPTSRGRDGLTRDDRTSGGTAHLRRLAREHGHQIGAMTPVALDGGQPP